MTIDELKQLEGLLLQFQLTLGGTLELGAARTQILRARRRLERAGRP